MIGVVKIKRAAGVLNRGGSKQTTAIADVVLRMKRIHIGDLEV